MSRDRGEQISSGPLGIDWRSGLGGDQDKGPRDRTSPEPGQGCGDRKEGRGQRAQEEKGGGLAWEVGGHSEERVVSQ